MGVRTSFVFLAIAAAVPAAVIMGGAVPTAAADECPDVELVFARGTAEPPGMGRVGDALFTALQPLLGGRSLGAYPVNYPASYNFLTTSAGADDARGRVAWLADQCPNTRVVLGGFSQGAAAVSMLAGVQPVGSRVGSFGSASPLDPGLVGKVAAVAVFGNPASRFGTPLSSNGQFAGRSIDLCGNSDPICSVGARDRSAHNNYDAPPYPGQAAGFITGLV